MGPHGSPPGSRGALGAQEIIALFSGSRQASLAKACIVLDPVTDLTQRLEHLMNIGRMVPLYGAHPRPRPSRFRPRAVHSLLA
jgi:hypothetical protein